MHDWVDGDPALGDGIDGDPSPGRTDVGPTVIGLLMGLEMMRRIDPTAVTDDVALRALRDVVLGTRTTAAA